MSASVAFYCVASAAYFPGATAMINSLRLVGHAEPIYVLGWGLTDSQRGALATEATVVDAPAGREPYALKPVLPLAHPAEVMVLIDTDVIATRSLEPLIAEAARGRVVAFRNNVERFVPEWGPLLDLAPIRRRPYVCSGLVAMDQTPGEAVLRLLDDRQGRVDLERSYFGRHDPTYPLLYADQDVLNAILASEVEDERLVALDHRLAPMTPFDGVRAIDEDALRCAYADGTEPYLLHHSLSPKPWQARTPDGIYTRFLRRALTRDDVAIRLPAGQVPPTLRTGPRAAAQRLRVRARERLRRRLGSFAP